ncbi:methyl-accepting chemotaxis protein [Pseudoalteromonas marina]|nr:methyl-accepting chemotaxis protein [Pseudoalteromonas marina]
MNKIGQELIDIAEEDIPLTKLLTQITEQQLQQAILFERFLLHVLMSEQGKFDTQNLTIERDNVATVLNKTQKEISETQRFIQKALPLLHSEDARNEYSKLLAELNFVDTEFQALTLKVTNITQLGLSGNINKMLKQAKSVESLEDKIDDKLIEMLDRIQSFTLKAAITAEQHEQKAVSIIIVLFILAVLWGAIMPTIIANSITKPISSLNERLHELANGDGDLRIRLNETAKDETGTLAKSFNAFLNVLSGMISKVNQQAGDLDKSSGVVVHSTQASLDNVLLQREEITSVATAIQEMSCTTQEVARSTAEASLATESVKERVMLGQAGATETQEVITKVAEEVANASAVIESLVAETNNIGSVLETIQGIAEQTNLLALNAAIEAARAGDTGRGFAVVADEVRQLAQRTQTSTVDIQKLVERLQDEAKNAVESMEKGSESTQLCLEKSTENASLFEQAALSVGEISDLNTQIATAAEEQSVVAEEINQSLNSINEIANVTADQTKQSASENNTIAKRITELVKELSIFKTS